MNEESIYNLEARRGAPQEDKVSTINGGASFYMFPRINLTLGDLVDFLHAAIILDLLAK